VVFSKRFVLILLPKVNEKALSKPGFGRTGFPEVNEPAESNAIRIDARPKKIGGGMLPQE
jgi:hypothetical protein